MKITRLLFILALVLLGLEAKAQTLGQILRASQKRTMAQWDRGNAFYRLQEEAGYPDVPEPETLPAIQWAGLSDHFNDEEIAALSVDGKLRLLKQVWSYYRTNTGFLDSRKVSSGRGYLEPISFVDDDRRITKENFGETLKALAYRLSQLHAFDWPVLTQYDFPGSTTQDLSSLPQPPLSLGVQANGNSSSQPDVSEDISTAIWISGGSATARLTPGHPLSYSYSTSSKTISGVQSIAPISLSGSLKVFSSFGYATQAISGLGPGYNGPESSSVVCPLGGSSITSIAGLFGLGIDSSSLSFPGSWQEIPFDGGFGNIGLFIPTFPHQNFWSNAYDPRSPDGTRWDWVDPQLQTNPYSYPQGFFFRTFFDADFSDEFALPSSRNPEELPPLQVVPSLGASKLKVRLANGIGADCELVIQAPSAYIQGQPSNTYFEGSLSARGNLTVQGGGEWDAVYSGKVEDRAAEAEWQSGILGAQARWPNFRAYLSEWWKPVLTQLVTAKPGQPAATYGLNITQQGRYAYRIDFYRGDQIGAKSSETGRYAFSGTPVESWTIANPTADDAQPGSLKITTPKFIYDVNLTQVEDATLGQWSKTWTFSAKNAVSGAVLLNKNVSTAPAITDALEDGSPFYTIMSPYEVVDSTTVDGQALPKVTTTYWSGTADPLRIGSIKEEGTEGTRNTTYTYEWKDDEAGNNLPDHLTKIEQTGGVNPYEADYDDNEQLTKWVSGPSEVDVSYSGMVVTRTEKFAGSTVKVEATTYSGDMTTATTVVNGAGDAVSSVVQLNAGTDSVNPWALKRVQGFDGTLTTYDYAWNGSNFVTTILSGRGTGNMVSAGTKVVARVNAAGKVFSSETDDIESGAKLDFAEATQYGSGTPYFPTTFSRPLGTTEGYTYDGMGQVLAHKDQLGITSTYTPDALGRITRIVRNGVTTDIAYNPGYLGRYITISSAGEPNRTQDERISPFGGTQSLTITGPENVTVTRTETASTVTTVTQNTTTAQNTTEVVQKATMATAVTGNATEPWNISYSFPTGGGWKQKTTHGSMAALTATNTYDPLGRLRVEETPKADGSAGVATTTYGYVGGRLDSAADLVATTSYGYQPDGSLGQVSRGGRTMSLNRVTSSSSQIKWEAKNGAGEVEWQQAYNPATGVSEQIPWGDAARKITSTPQISGDTLTLSASGPYLSGSSQWKDGAPLQGTVTSAGATASWSAAPNVFGEVLSTTVQPGGAAGSPLTTSFSTLGLPTGTSGLISSTISNSFGASGFAQTLTRNGHAVTQSISPKGDSLADTGYGKPDATWSAPSFGSSAITKTMSTLAGAPQFSWNPAGTLKERKFPDGSGETFAYDGNGGLKSRTSPRGTLDFAPNAFGQPTQMGALGNLRYDGAGRPSGEYGGAAGSSTQTYVEGSPNVLSYRGGPLPFQFVDRDYDSLGRLQTVKLPGGVSIGYTYGSDGALATVKTAGGKTGTWSNTDAITGKAKNFTLGALSTVTGYDGLGRTTSRVSTANGNATSYSSYSYNGDGHCDGYNSPHGSWTLGYDGNGYLQSASGWKSFTYGFDEAGRPSGAVDFHPQVRLNSTVIDVFGSVAPAATLTINGTAVPVAADGQFLKSYTPPASTWQTYLVRGTLAGAGVNGTTAIAEEVRNIFVPPPSESLGSDLSGNRQGDARWTLGWNALDQLTSWVEWAPLSTTTANRVDCIYDLQGRRLEKKTSVGGVVTTRTTTLWDGWRPVMDIDYGSNGAKLARRYYTWGPDVSGSLDGAAGIGGLLEVMETKGTTTTLSLPIYDGLGNVVGLVDATSGVRMATYDYGPFGEVLNVYGPRASSCPFRYQTKRYDEELGTYYFGKRYLDPKTHTWLNRDPLREDGGTNLYAYCNNDPVGNFDPVGLDPSFWMMTSGMTADQEVAASQAAVGISWGIITSPYYAGQYAGEQGVAAYDLALNTGSTNAEALTLATGVTVTRATGALNLIEATMGGQEIVGDSNSGLSMQDFSGNWARGFHGVAGGLQLVGSATGLNMLGGTLAKIKMPSVNPHFLPNALKRASVDTPFNNNFESRVIARGIPPLRQQYIDEVVGLEDLGLSARAAGADAESVARMLHADRRALGIQYKELTPPDELARITLRNIKEYNDPLGPSIEWLRGRGKTWEQIIKSASTPGGKDLGY